jgi:quercetin dioxygenase-like cupin family protein
MKPTILTNYREAVVFREGQFSPVGIGGTERMKAVLACFEPGQFIPVHSPAVDMTLVVLEGEGQMVAGDWEGAIGPGAMIIVPAGAARGIKATTRLVVLHLVAPPPTEADHSAVQAGLARGAWR